MLTPLVTRMLGLGRLGHLGSGRIARSFIAPKDDAPQMGVTHAHQL